MESFLKSIIDNCTPVALKLLASLVILIIGLRLIKWGVKKLKNGKLMNKVDTSLASFLLSAVKIVLYVVLVLTLASILGIPMASFVTILASAGVAIGLALQGSLANLAGGVMILLFRPFRVGDYIKTPDCEGTVKDITVFYTIITTDDNKVITLPNGNLTNKAVTNYSVSDIRRVDLTYTAASTEDVANVKKALLDTAAAHAGVLKDPAPVARLNSHSSAACEFTLHVWCKNDEYWDVYYELQELIKKAFDKN